MENFETLDILLVEDNPDHIELITSELTESQWIKGVRVARDGKETLTFLSQFSKAAIEKRATCPSLILLDIGIPKIDGLTVLQKLKSDPCLRLIPVLILTTSSRQEDIEKAKELGANGYLVKSFYPATLVEKVMRALKEKSFIFLSH